jgi:flagellar biosynthesis/type III secretory pathway protein FliH
MARLVTSLCLAASIAFPAHAQDLHLSESGSAVVLSRSAFAHGYRHGYEEGYHVGNVDISLGTAPRAKIKDVRGLKLGYSPQFGPRHVFELGFQAGLKAGYSDGYSGRLFRAVDSMRSVAASLQESGPPADPKFIHFDEGFFSGYNEGFDRGGADQSSTAEVDFHFVGCSNFHPRKQQDLPAQESYCDGYRRGFALGHADGFVLRPDSGRLEASK